MSSFYITTPIYYVNDKPHLGPARRAGLRAEGQATTTLWADALARYRRALGDKVDYGWAGVINDEAIY
ncbi:MAG: class I tRNA ligase family protein [Candidatus Marinimicrobia bacterium]|nr:class I tRNA ligase family protein [Candidatus Neomarinimicrobiota bacterium]